ncbi:hypothetical protein GCM10027184_02090 [Saccharothrix stipae]
MRGVIRHSAAAYREPAASFDHVAQSPDRPGEADVDAAAANTTAEATATNATARAEIAIPDSPPALVDDLSTVAAGARRHDPRKGRIPSAEGRPRPSRSVDPPTTAQDYPPRPGPGGSHRSKPTPHDPTPHDPPTQPGQDWLVRTGWSGRAVTGRGRGGDHGRVVGSTFVARAPSTRGRPLKCRPRRGAVRFRPRAAG